jgi:hypothetical protein
MELSDLRQSRSRIRRRLSYGYNNRGSNHDRLPVPIKIPAPIASSEVSEEERASESEDSSTTLSSSGSRERIKLYAIQWWPPSEFWNTCISCQIPPGADIRDFFGKCLPCRSSFDPTVSLLFCANSVTFPESNTGALENLSAFLVAQFTLGVFSVSPSDGYPLSVIKRATRCFVSLLSEYLI